MRHPGPGLLLLTLLAAGAPADETNTDKGEELAASTLPAKREEAAALLAKPNNTTAAKRVMKMLDDKDWGVQIAAIHALGPIQYQPGRDAIRKKALTGEIRAIRIAAARMLRDHDPSGAALKIGGRLTKLKAEARLPAIEVLGIIGSKEAVEALSKQMRAPEPSHRLAAARALGRIGAGEKALLNSLKDKEKDVALTVAAALATIDSDRVRAALIEHIEKKTPDFTESYLLSRVGRRAAKANREAFAKALDARVAKAKKPGALLRVALFGGIHLESAREHFDHRDSLTRAFAYRVAGLGEAPLTAAEAEKGLSHKDHRVRYAAAVAVLDVEGEPLTAALKVLLRHKKPDVEMVAVRKAVETRNKDVLGEVTDVALGKTPAKRDWQVRVAAIVGIGRIGFDRDFSALETLAGAREWQYKAAAYEGLYHTYSKVALPILIDAFNDRHPVARMTARRNLRLMSGKHFLKKKMYVSWWEKVKDNLELKHPEKKLEELDKYGYSTRKYLQEVLRGTDIIAIKGRWDKVELILEDLSVKHNAWRAQELKQYGLSPKQVVLVNCEGSVDSETTKFLQWLVVAGGYMATSDWSLVNATTKTFPNVVGGYVRQSTGNDVVIVEAAAPGHPTLKGVFREDMELMWWLEIQAFPIAVEDPVRCTVLVDSLQMLDRYGSSAMMVEFPAGLGKVLHSTSHFYLQKEGFAHASSVEKRKIFAADHLGLSVEEIRELDAKGAFGNINDTTAISKSYSMFHLLVNFINEKRAKDLAR